MSLQPRQIELIRRTCRKLEPIGRTFSELFYRRLSDLDPRFAAALRNADPAADEDSADRNHWAMGCDLMQFISSVVAHLNNVDALAPAVAAMGRSKFGAFVKPEDYDLVGQALLWTLARGLEDDFTDEAKLAWLDAYALLAEAMEQSIREQHAGEHAQPDSTGGIAAAA